MRTRRPIRHSTAAARILLSSAVAGVALIPVMFLSWYGLTAEAGAGVPHGTAWEVFTKLDIILTVSAVLGAGSALVLGALARRRGIPGWTLLGGAVAGAIGTVATGMLVYRIVDLPGDDAVMTLEPGAFVGLGLIATLALTGWIATAIGLRAVREGHVVGLGPVTGAPPDRRLPSGDSPREPGPPPPALPRVR